MCNGVIISIGSKSMISPHQNIQILYFNNDVYAQAGTFLNLKS